MILSPQEHILIHYGEVGLKRKIQLQFRRMLQRNIHQTLKYHGYRAPVSQARGYLSVDLEKVMPSEQEKVLELIQNVFGIIWYAKAIRIKYAVPADTRRAEIIQFLNETIVHLATEKADPKKTYCVRVRRSDKRFPAKSIDLERDLGALIKEKTAFKTVRLNQPDYTFYAEIQPREIYIYCDKFPGLQGLPVGSAGRVLTLLSGGIDSPVAAYLIAKRGCKVDFIHFAASHLTPDQARTEKISRLVAHLSRYTLYSRLYMIPYTYFQLALPNRHIRFELVLFRRFMARVAEKISWRSKAKALVTGDNLSQVASQTIWNIASTVSVVNRPILQPLISYEKLEIINLARKIETYDISIEPYKDCCSLISQHPDVSSQSKELDRLEDEIFTDYRKMIKDSINDIVTLEYRMGDLLLQTPN